MNRKGFLKSLVLGLASLPVIGCLKVRNKRNRIVSGTGPNYGIFVGDSPSKGKPKLGFISVKCCPIGTRCGDWTILKDEKSMTAKCIQSANDITGRYEYLDHSDKHILKSSYGNLRFVYRGENPDYKHFV